MHLQTVSGMYPTTGAAQTEWILKHRRSEERNALNPLRPYAYLLEEEPSDSGAVVETAVIFLTNRECPWHCLMCDLWKNTLEEQVPVGAIPAQIDYALSQLPSARQVKLYNSGSFFDPGAIPVGDYPAIAERLARFERVIVECHPALIGDSVLRFREILNGHLEIAIGLETADPDVLRRLNKRTSLQQIRDAAAFLRKHGVDVRMFALVQPPFSGPDASEWTQRTVEFAFDCGAGVVSLIPTRDGNGAMEALGRQGHFTPPTLGAVELAFARALELKRGRVFVDLWDLERFSQCGSCFIARAERLRQMNLCQQVLPAMSCPGCGGSL